MRRSAVGQILENSRLLLLLVLVAAALFFGSILFIASRVH
jgi:hypothetical protein